MGRNANNKPNQTHSVAFGSSDFETSQQITGGDVSYWDDIAAQWHQTRDHSLWRRHSDSVHSDLLARWLPVETVERVLKTDLFDEAVSDGMVPILAQCARSVSGIDVSPVVADIARQRYPTMETHVADVCNLPFETDTFDVIFSNSTLDHFPSQEDIQIAIAELARVLCEGGRLLLTLDNLANPMVWLRNALPQKLLMRLGIVPYRMGVTCGPIELADYVRQPGLEVVEVTTILHCPRVLAVSISTLLQRWTMRYDGDNSRSQERRDDIAKLYLRALAAWERLGHWPTRFRTGYFTAINAYKPSATKAQAMR